MSCTDNTCGVGGFPGPKPGDPDNLVSLHASTAYGGIDVVWTYPTTNPFAVAHVRLLRGPSNDFAQASERAIVAGNGYYDKIDVAEDTEFYYWIRIVSTNGTVFDPIGPASAYARPKSKQTLEELTGLIDDGILAQTLKTKISGITLTNQALYDEINKRLLSDQGFADALARVQSGLDQAMTYVNEEITQRQDGDDALVHAIDIIAAANSDNLAAIVEERNVRITADSALAEQITDLIAETGDNTAAIQEELRVLTTQQQATAQDVEQLATTVGDSNAGLIHDMEATSTALSSLASDFTTVEAAVNGDIATGQVGLIAKVDTVTGQVYAMWTAKVEVNGLIGGFGLANDGEIVEAGFDVDRFWIGRTGPDRVKPFIIDSGIVYINKAVIRDADIDSLKIAGSAVTVPIVARNPNIVKGTGEQQWHQLVRGYIKLNQSGIVYAHCICSQRYGQGVRTWNMRISINGVVGSVVGGLSVADTPVIAMSTGLPAGTYPVVVDWWGKDNGVFINGAELFIMGAKR